jgi:8-oxo-dGTP diphosphatase
MSEWIDAPVFGHAPDGTRPTLRPSAYALVSDADGRIAVVRTPQGLYLPGGGMDAGETVEDTVVREVREECGLVVRAASWRTRAVDIVFARAEQGWFEKRSTFVEATVVGDPVPAVDVDHALEWITPALASSALALPAHRWAAARWAGRSRP